MDLVERRGRAWRRLLWLAPLLLYVFFVFGRVLLGGQVGWMSVIAVLWAPIILPSIFAAALINLGDRPARRARSVRKAVAGTGIVWWLLALVYCFVVPDGGDNDPWSSAFSEWTGGTEESALRLSNTVLVVALCALAVHIGTTIWSTVQSRRSPEDQFFGLPA